MKTPVSSSAAATPYTLQMTRDIARQLQRVRASIRKAIEGKLQEVVAATAGRSRPSRAAAEPGAPPLRFYVFEGYRVSYAIRPISRTVTVLGIRSEPG